MSAQLRSQAVEIYRQGLAAVAPDRLLREALSLEADSLRIAFLERAESVPLVPAGRMVVLAVGKAAAPMARAAAEILGSRVSEGLVVTKRGFSLPDLPFPVREAGHPIPDPSGVEAAIEAEALVGRLSSDDTLLVLVSGGASALLPAPVAGVTLADKQRLAALMLRHELDIHQINRVRKAISRFKGGGLAHLAAPARVVGLYLSDVPGDALSSIGSGPTVPETPDYPGVIALLRERGIWEETPVSVRSYLEGQAGEAQPKSPPAAPVNGLIGANRHLLRAMGAAAEGLGFLTRIEEAPTTGLNPAALELLQRRWKAHCEANPGGNLCLISGGETLVEVTGDGLGGRCQELAALMMPRLEERAVFLAAGSDGNDGPTDAAGGVVDRESFLAMGAARIPYEELLRNNDSYHLLERTGNLIKVPPTRNNLMDVHLFLRE